MTVHEVHPRVGRSQPSLRRLRSLSVAVLVVLASALVLPDANAETYVPISGAGSTWSQNALDQWRRNVNQYGLRVNYQGTGSSDGRNQFRNGTVDFAVTEIPYGLKDGGVVDQPPQRPFAYMPIVAGGTSFMYNLKIGGRRVTNLRLSGENLTKIFTGVLKKWSDPAIKADNPGLTLPARQIVPVVRSDGSGTTAQATSFFSKKYASLWDSYCARAGRPTPCGSTSFFPVIPGSGFTAQSGSLGVSGYVSQGQNEGTITYVEYSYALNAGFPVVKVLNNAGYYVEPTSNSVAVALLAAQIDENPSSSTYLTPNLIPVYNNADRRTYPLSSYSYMVIPTGTTNTFSVDKGKTLGAFAYYFLCEGQQQAPVLGYSPLPINLVQAGLKQVRRIPGVQAQSIDIRKCNNPTFSSSGVNTLAKTAPYPTACDRQGRYQCTAGTGGAASTPTSVNAGATPGGTSSAGSSGGNSSSGGTAGAGKSNGTGGGGSNGTTAGGGTGRTGVGTAGGTTGTTIDPDTGQVVQQGANTSGGGDGSVVAAVPVTTDAASGWHTQQSLMLIAALLLLGMVIGPPLFARRMQSQGGSN